MNSYNPERLCAGASGTCDPVSIDRCAADMEHSTFANAKLNAINRSIAKDIFISRQDNFSKLPEF